MRERSVDRTTVDSPSYVIGRNNALDDPVYPPS